VRPASGCGAEPSGSSYVIRRAIERRIAAWLAARLAKSTWTTARAISNGCDGGVARKLRAPVLGADVSMQ
jgi:hypothetical protein